MKKMFQNLIMLFAFLGVSLGASAQSRTITGKVSSDEAGEALIGVSVMVKGSKIGTVTNSNGDYSISVPVDKNTLVFTYVGYKAKEVKISGTVVNSTLEEDVVGLEAAVVTAMAIKRQTRALGYSTAEVGGQALVNSGEVNVIQGLAAKTTGVQVIGSSGTPGGSSKILIRGNSTFTGNNQPLIVVDGVPIDNSQGNINGSSASDYPFNSGLGGVNSSNRALDLNPEDIESVTVLKGPAAAALYGVRAGNGAIIYTTKKAKQGIRAVYTSSMEISMVNKLPDLQDKYAQGTGGGVLGGTPKYSVADPGPDGLWFTDDDVALGGANSWGPLISSVPGLTSHDNMGDFFRTAYSFNNNIAVSGGNANSSFRLSAGNTIQNGVVPNTDLKRNSIRLTGETKVSDKLSFGGTANYVKTDGTMAQNGSNLSGVMLGLTRAPASFNLKGTGEEGWKLPSGNQRQYFYVYDNPWWSVYENPNYNDVNRIIGNFNVLYDPFEWMKVTYRLGTDYYTDKRKQIFAVHSWDPPNPTGQIEEFSSTYREVYSDLIVNMSKEFNEKMNGSLSLGNNLNQRFSQDLYLRGRDLNVPNFYNLGNATDLYAGEANSTIRTAAFFFDAQYEYDKMLYVGVTGRNEWASTFGPNKNNFFYPSANASFVFTEILNQPNVAKILPFGKLRLSWARSGINPAAYATQTYFSRETYTDGFTDGIGFPYLGVNGYQASDVLGNQDLRPETLTGTEVGVDLRFLKGRLNLDVTYYNQKTTDILLFRPIAPSSGFQNYYSNSGEMVNKGWEIAFGGTPIKRKNFKWEANMNFTKNISEVLKLGEGVDEIDIETAFSSIGSYAIVGQPYGALYGTRWKRTSDGQLLINPTTGLPLIESTRGNIGNPFPDWLMNIKNNFKYKNLSLNTLIDIRKGGDIWNGTYARLNRLGVTEASADREKTYVIEGVVADAKGESTGQKNTKEISAFNYYNRYVGDNGSATEQAVEDGSWVRLRELTINYDLDMKKIKSGRVKGLSFYVTGRNLWLSTNYQGVDPETSLTGSGSNVNGFDYFNMPGTKSYIIGLRASF